jgi:hypothetical protein
MILRQEEQEDHQQPARAVLMELAALSLPPRVQTPEGIISEITRPAKTWIAHKALVVSVLPVQSIPMQNALD